MFPVSCAELFHMFPEQCQQSQLRSAVLDGTKRLTLPLLDVVGGVSDFRDCNGICAPCDLASQCPKSDLNCLQLRINRLSTRVTQKCSFMHKTGQLQAQSNSGNNMSRFAS